MKKVEATRSLTLRLVALLTIALLPLGLIAVFQTYRVVSDAEEVSEREMLARTFDVARRQVELIVEAQGAATALGAAVSTVDPGSEVCTNILRTFTQDQAQFVFAGFIEADGMMRCSNQGETVDFTEFEDWTSFRDNPRPRVTFNHDGAVSGLSVLIVSTPVFEADGTFLGGVSVSIPHSLLDTLAADGIEDVDVAITNGSGQITSVSGEKLGERLAGIESFRPADLEVPEDGKVVEIDSYQSVSVVPVAPFDLYVVGTWTNGSNPLSVSTLGTAAPLFPIAMWLASLFVAIFAIQGLVLKHMKRLRYGMRKVSLDNIKASYVKLENAPTEISEIGDSYNALLNRISSDANALEEAANEKELLLKEVHHRVKNNLQLIASILNMQLRQISSPDAQSVLRRVQQRVMSLAAIHKLLYTDTKIDLVRADILLSEIINNTVSLGSSGKTGPQTSISLDPVELDPDRAVPLALLTTEAVTNALKYVGADDGSAGTISVSLTDPDQGELVLKITNTLGAPARADTDDDGTGLGSKLITAFVTQLDGTSRVENDLAAYTIVVTFPKTPYNPAVQEAA
ncbi:MAG: sensor histidine kinase [Paracoccaceae bacterium]